MAYIDTRGQGIIPMAKMITGNAQAEALLFKKRWLEQMQPTVSKLLRQESVSEPEWYKLVADVDEMKNFTDKMYTSLQEEFILFIREAEKRILQHQDEEDLLNSYTCEWTRFWTQCYYLQLSFDGLDTFLLTLSKQRNTNSQKEQPFPSGVVKRLLLCTWKEIIFSSMKQELLDAAMDIVYKERCNEKFSPSLVIAVRDSFVNLCLNARDQLQLYRHFEKAYIDSTRSFYLRQAGSYLSENGSREYIKYAYTKLKEEEQRASKYLEPVSQMKLHNCCMDVLVSPFKGTISSECQYPSSHIETEEFRLLFLLSKHELRGTDHMLPDLEDHMLKSGLLWMKKNASEMNQDPEKFVELLLFLFRRFSKLLNDAFNGNPRILTTRDKAFKKVVNDTSLFSFDLPSSQGATTRLPAFRCPELLADYCDMLLRKTPLSKRLTSDEVDSRLKDVLLVLKYSQNRDVFMGYYRAYLTRRLMLDTSADSDKEENMVKWLKEADIPAYFLNECTGMIQDIKVSCTLNDEFKDVVATGMINVKILNPVAWDDRIYREYWTGVRVPLSIPQELDRVLPKVEDFFHLRDPKRKLHWHHRMSSGTIRFTNETGEYDLDVTTFQMVVLSAWNETQEKNVSFGTLQSITGLTNAELRKTLWSLVAFPKLKQQVLSYSPACQSQKDFTNSSIFWINEDFALIRNGKAQQFGKVNLIGRLQLVTEKDKDEEDEAIMKIREFRTQMAIIRSLRTWKWEWNMPFSQLQADVLGVLEFTPTRKFIKYQLELLIEQELVRRDENNIHALYYVYGKQENPA